MIQPTNQKITKKRNEIMINQERDQFYHLFINNNFMKRRKSANKQTKERKYDDSFSTNLKITIKRR